MSALDAHALAEVATAAWRPAATPRPPVEEKEQEENGRDQDND